MSDGRSKKTRSGKGRKPAGSGRKGSRTTAGKSTRPRRKSANSKRKTANGRKHRYSWKRVLLAAGGLLLLLLLVQLWYLQSLIDARFDGETWARPSRVYARPLELFEGLELTPQQLMRELELADYRAVRKLQGEGEFSFASNRLDLHVRPFTFMDGPQPAQRLRLRFEGGRIRSLRDLDSGQPLDLLRLTPVLIGSFIPGNGEDRRVVDFEEIPPQLVDILLSVEDRRFYEHHGVSPMSILRALWANLRAGRTVQGGSTLTQQLAKNLFLSSERSLWRKANEALLALMLELRFDKNTILTAYVNEVFLLQHNRVAVHGFALASRLLFHQPLNELDTDQLALLVGMVKGPGIYNPIKHPKRALKRRNQVLAILREAGRIDPERYRELAARPLGVAKQLPPVNPFPAYLDLVKKQLARNYSAEDLSEQGLRVFTAFDPLRQLSLEAGLKRGLRRFDQPELQAAVVLADYLSGELLALVGDRQTDYPGFNRAILAQRPIGSLIKPMLLYGLLQKGQTLATPVEDRPIRIEQSDGKIWEPANYDKKLHGEMTLYQAFIKSYNLPFVRLGVKQGGLEALAENLQKLGLLKQSVVYPSMLLGATPMTPFEVAQLYQTIANSGYFAPLSTLRGVVDKQGQRLTRVPLSSRSLYDRSDMIQVQRAMIGVTEEGTARYLAQRFPGQTLAGKTGTTDDARDSWFAGFTDRLLTVVWLGSDGNQPIGLTGSSGALRVWADVMDEVGITPLRLEEDPQLEWHYVDRYSGALSSRGCKNSVLLPFRKGRAPDFRSACIETNLIQRAIQWLQESF